VDIRNLTAAVSRRELLAAGYSPSEIVAAVRRGDLIRLAPGRANLIADEGWTIVRWDWDDLEMPGVVVRRIRRALAGRAA